MTPNFHRNTTTDKGDTSVTHHAKASSAGSSMRQGSRLGRIVRGAFAFFVFSRDAKGTSAPAAAQGTGAPAYRRYEPVQV
ncbi:MAG TPA: hypothetical protein VFP23_05790 [Solirubrobacterales bacterium]|nr:hypothetical protein [Solirubrobacterales bacterium]